MLTKTNHPDLWRHKFPWPSSTGNKYDRGHLLVVGGARMLGASRLACLAAARSGAGLVTLAVPQSAWAIQAAALTAIMVEALPADHSVLTALHDVRRNALLIGPGLGLGPDTRMQVSDFLACERPCVLDADALTSFADKPQELLARLHNNCVLTPHAGEFARVFDFSGTRVERALLAARASGCVVVLKGHKTVIANHDGRYIINDNAPASLATAGSGDVLAGIIGGLLAAGMPVFDAACAAVWLHGLSADLFGIGLIADDLPAVLPQALGVLAQMLDAPQAAGK